MSASRWKYVIVTPVRDEEDCIEKTIAAIANQTLKPAEWVIVDDGSTDRTGEILDRYAREMPWIRVVHRKNRGFRKNGAGVVEAFKEGYRALTCLDFDVIAKLDGDLGLNPDYFEQILDRFEKQPRLGIAGGEIRSSSNGGGARVEKNPIFHVRGATKIYRRECWEDIEGLYTAPGWDTIDEVKANMHGWTSQTFPELELHQFRPTGTVEGWWKDRIKNGRAYYVCGYHPLFFAGKFLYRLTKPPYIVGSCAMLFGFVSGYFGAVARVDDPALVNYLRREQMKRLLGKQTIWR